MNLIFIEHKGLRGNIAVNEEDFSCLVIGDTWLKLVLVSGESTTLELEPGYREEIMKQFRELVKTWE